MRKEGEDGKVGEEGSGAHIYISDANAGGENVAGGARNVGQQ